MMYVVVEELVPEMSGGRHSNLGTIMFATGFSLMMALDVALGQTGIRHHLSNRKSNWTPCSLSSWTHSIKTTSDIVISTERQTLSSRPSRASGEICFRFLHAVSDLSRNDRAGGIRHAFSFLSHRGKKRTVEVLRLRPSVCKRGDDLLFHMVVQYHRRGRA